MKTNFLHKTGRAFSYILLLILVFHSGCSVYDNNEQLTDCLVPVRVAMLINESKAVKPSTRSTGSYEDKTYEEGTDPGTENERYVGTVRVLVFDTGSGNLRFNKLFSRSAANPGDQFDHNIVQGTLTVDFTLLSGIYDFRIIANEEVDWNLANLTVGSSTRTDFENLTSLRNITNVIKTETELQWRVSNNQKGIPMLGESQFIIPDNPSNITNPVVLPTIELKRTITKVQVYLTNIDYTTDKIYPSAATYQIKSGSLKNVNQKYHLLETNDPVDNEALESTPASDISHVRGANYPLTRILYTYMAERKNVNEANTTVIEIRVDKTGEGEIVYNIPLYKGTTAPLNYSLSRNHFYRVNCYLAGAEMPYVEIFYSDTDWNLVTKELFMGYGYNVEVEGDKITVSNTVDACDPHQIRLETVSPFTFSDGSTVKEFDSLVTDASANYTLNSVPSVGSGDYLKVVYNDEAVKTFTK